MADPGLICYRRAAGSSTKQTPSRKTKTSGELIVSNWSSYIDVLYLAFRYVEIYIDNTKHRGDSVDLVTLGYNAR